MSKYYFIFHNADGKILTEYDTDIVPPARGDLVNLSALGKDETVYIVRDRTFKPTAKEHLIIIFTLDPLKQQ